MVADPKIQKFKSELFKAIEADPKLDSTAKAAVIANAEAVGAEIPDTKVYRWAVGGLVGISVLIIIGAIAVELLSKEIPAFFGTVIAVAIGALAGMLGYTRATDT